MCNKACEEHDCPFAMTEASEIAQSYGCLPSSYEIVGMRIFHNKTWACHSDPSKPCRGALKFLKDKGIDCRVIDKTLIDERNITPDMIDFSEEQRRKLSLIMRHDYCHSST